MNLEALMTSTYTPVQSPPCISPGISKQHNTSWSVVQEFTSEQLELLQLCPIKILCESSPVSILSFCRFVEVSVGPAVAWCLGFFADCVFRLLVDVLVFRLPLDESSSSCVTIVLM